MRWLCGVLLVLASGAGGGREDQYLHIFDLMQQAEKLTTNGQVAPALAKVQKRSPL